MRPSDWPCFATEAILRTHRQSLEENCRSHCTLTILNGVPQPVKFIKTLRSPRISGAPHQGSRRLDYGPWTISLDRSVRPPRYLLDGAGTGLYSYTISPLFRSLEIFGDLLVFRPTKLWVGLTIFGVAMSILEILYITIYDFYTIARII